MNARGVVLHVLTVTKNGQPGHPLFLPGDLRPMPWTPGGAQ